MKFGHIEDITQVHWALPPDTLATNTLFENIVPCNVSPSVYIGCSVWTDRGFVGKLYPLRCKATEYLRNYCQQFNTVELNGTFYSCPSIERVQLWKSMANNDFKFCPKFPKSISHRKKIHENSIYTDTFINAMMYFGHTLGISFLQLPPYFKPTELSNLDKFLNYLPEKFSIAVELRHPDWFNDDIVRKEVFALFKEKKITSIITDVSGRRDILHQTLTSPYAFIRFKGNDLHPTDYIRLDDWAARITVWLEKGLQKVFFLFHTMTKHLCIDLAIYMIEKLQKYNKNIKIKKPIIKNIPHQVNFL